MFLICLKVNRMQTLITKTGKMPLILLWLRILLRFTLKPFEGKLNE